uniref:Uncharacterized protein LOC102801433 n=1 Tax=Saccoglossus kowalevskii TaxID=10224 RepID=A0ABM0MZ51_SACKO|nr:PREDICTED: uncharacterized protein LOC102801433 [Saccoglossus kowalevskii]
MQLLGEKQYLHPYSRTNNKLGQMLPDTTIPTSAQTTPNQNKTFGSNLHSTHLDDYDWPSSDTESMSSDEVEITGNHVAPLTPNSTSTPSKYVPQGERTAKQIMELLELMGSPNSIDKHSLLDHAFYPCRCCSGELITL